MSDAYYLAIGPIQDEDGFTAEDRKEWLEDAGWTSVQIIAATENWQDKLPTMEQLKAMSTPIADWPDDEAVVYCKPGCRINPIMSCVCAKGTRCCIVDHAAVEQAADEVILEDYGD